MRRRRDEQGPRGNTGPAKSRRAGSASTGSTAATLERAVMLNPENMRHQVRLLPIEPLLGVRQSRDPWAPALAALHLRAR